MTNEMTEEELKLWQQILHETPTQYESKGSPNPVGFWYNCPVCGDSLIYYRERRNPRGTDFICMICKNVWFESEESENEHNKMVEAEFEKRRKEL